MKYLSQPDMIESRKHVRYGDTVSEWVPRNVAELESDAVSLSSIIIDGRFGFELSGSDLEVFVGLCVRELLRHGAVPVIGGGESAYDWIHQNQYGTGTDDIISNVIAEWKASGSDPDLGGLWFARPDREFPMFVKLE